MDRKKLKEARTKRHWTLEQAAERIGVSVNTLSGWERGKSRPYAYNVQRICEVYETTPEELGLSMDCDEREETSAGMISPSQEVRAFVDSDLTMRLLSLAFTYYGGFYMVFSQLQCIIGRHNAMNADNNAAEMTRREALYRLAMFSMLTLGLDAVARNPQHILAQSAASIAAWWELWQSGEANDPVLALDSVSVYLPVLKEIVKTSAQYRKEAAALVGRGALLSSMFAYRAHTTVTVQYAQEAVIYSKESGDLALWVSAVDWLVWAHYHNKNSKQALEEIERIMPVLKEQEALLLKKQEASLPARLLGGVYSAYAVMLARNGKSGTKTIQHAHETFRSASSEELDTGYYSLPEIIGNGAHVHYYQGEYDAALEVLGKLIDVNDLSTKVPMPARISLGMLNRMTLASLKRPEKDMELSTKLWQAQMQGAIERKSARLYQDGLNSYDIMEALWPQEARVKELRDLIVR